MSSEVTALSRPPPREVHLFPETEYTAIPFNALFEACAVSEKDPPTYTLSPSMAIDVTGAFKPPLGSAARAPFLKTTILEAPEADPFDRVNCPPRKIAPEGCWAATATEADVGAKEEDPPSAVKRSTPAPSRLVSAEVGMALFALTVEVELRGHSRNPKLRSEIFAVELLPEEELEDVTFALVRMN